MFEASNRKTVIPFNSMLETPAILYVDDERENLMIFKTTFRRTYKVFTAQSASEGLELLDKHHNIQIVITDQRMPEMTGVEFIEHIVRKSPHIVRMIMTGYSDIEAIIQGVNKGQIYRYITKPWEQGDLKITIDQAFERFRLMEENKSLLLRLQKSNEELETQNHKIRSINQELDRFLYCTSHDLKGPIARLLGLAQLAKFEVAENNALADYVNRFEATAKDMGNMVDKLSDLHGVTHAEVTSEELLLADIVRSSCADLPSKIELDLRIDTDFRVRSYAFMLKRIFAYLLENVADYCTTHSRRTNQLRIWAQYTETHWQVTFWDNGIGIPEIAQDSVFQMFRRASEQSKGHGLGLYIVQRAVRRMQGNIHVRSIENEFTEFTLAFPKDAPIEKIHPNTEFVKGFFAKTPLDASPNDPQK